MPAGTVARLLDIWRDIERLLEELPPDDPHVPRLRAQLEGLRETYARLRSGAEDTAASLRSSQDTIGAAHLLLQRSRAAVAATGGPGVAQGHVARRRLVIQRGSRHWEVHDETTREHLLSAGLREEALLHARRLLREHGGEIVLVHGETGEPWKTVAVSPMGPAGVPRPGR
jgi:hypothetical protein